MIPGITAAALQAETDPFFANVVSLNHWDGVNGATTFTDQISGTTWTTGAGAVVLSSTTPKFGTTAVKFPGTGGNYVDSNSFAGLDYGTGDFTVETWFRIATLGTNILIDQRTSLSQPRVCIFQQAGSLLYFINGGVAITGSGLINDTWQHVALCRVSGTTRMFVDGTQTGANFTDSNNYTQGRIRIGAAGDNPGFGAHDGRYDDIRVTKGVGRYASNFTAPTNPFPNS